MIHILTEEMTRTQQLSLPRERLDAIAPEYLAQMASEGVVTCDGRRYGFGHESFFDYCFARGFLVREESLVAVLTTGVQHLFRRSQTRQVLSYLRDVDRTRYLQEMRGLLSDPQVRAHIKDIAFALLASVPDPGDDEWECWEPFVGPVLASIDAGTPSDAGRIAVLAWQHFSQSPSWFVYAVRSGMVAQWLSANSAVANAATTLLSSHVRSAPDLAAELLEPYADSGGEWRGRLRFVANWGDRTDSRRFFELMLHLVDNGVIDEAMDSNSPGGSFWSVFDGLGERRPDWVPEVITHWLRRRLTLVTARNETPTRANMFDYDHFAESPMAKSASSAPAEYVAQVLPVVLEISDRAVWTDAPAPVPDRVWPSLSTSRHLDPGTACLAGLVTAIRLVASEQEAKLRPMIDALRARSTYVANSLLLVLYTASAPHHAEEAAELLIAEPWRFDCGYSGSSHWVARELLRAVFGQCSTHIRQRLEAAVVGYFPAWEKGKDVRRHFGAASYTLLAGIPAERRSAAGNRRCAELQRKFGSPPPEPRRLEASFLGPPIEPAAARKMTDEQWLRAIEKYSQEGRFVRRSDGSTVGAWELAQSLEEIAREQPERLARLSLRFPPDANPVYLQRTISALRSAKIPSDLRISICRKAFAESPHECGSELADILGASEESLSDEAIEMLEWLSTQHPDPNAEPWLADDGGGQNYCGGDIYGAGINTARGRAAEAIRNLIWRDAAYLPRFSQVLDRMVLDPSTCVRSCVAGTLRAVYAHDAARAIALFAHFDCSDDRILATPHVTALLHSWLRKHLEDARPHIRRMTCSSNDSVAQAGGRLAGLAVLYHAEAGDLDREAAGRGASQRLGLAEVAAANVGSEDCRTWCEERLCTFFNDQDAKVRAEAASCYRQLREAPLDQCEPLILAFVDSMAFREDSFSVLYLLEQSPHRLPGLTCLVCEKFMERFGDEARDIRTARAGDVHQVAQLVFRTYHQHQSDEWTQRALDLIDQLCLELIVDVRPELDAFDR